jgi:transcriptional regulator with XRE-family HTH domain
MPSARARTFQELREARGLSTADVSHRLGVDEAMLRAWENDEGEPGDEHLPVLASLYGVSQDELRHQQDDAHHPDRA